MKRYRTVLFIAFLGMAACKKSPVLATVSGEPVTQAQFDAYLKLIEDLFLGGNRLDPKTDGRPDSRPTVREEVKILGDLLLEFDFDQEPLPPLILDPHPEPGPASTVG